MLLSFLLSASAAVFVHGSVVRRQDASCQTIPSTGKADGTFSNGQPQLTAEPPNPEGDPPTCYGARPDADLPFGRLFHGNAKFFANGTLNTPDYWSDKWAPDGTDSASQSACGIPDNAFCISKVAIHPYFLKYADLSRYCMQDVCISFWKEDGSSDMMLKVTDICSTDPSDPTHCESPVDIKVDRTKMKIMQGLTDQDSISAYPQLSGDEFPEKIWWFFTKCWADGLPQPAYQGNNWFTTPKLPNNLNWSQSEEHKQWQTNQDTYPAKGWETYPQGAYNTQRDDTTAPPIGDWSPGDATPAWQPIAGGKGWGQPGGSGPAAGSSSSPSSAAVNAASAPSASGSAASPTSMTGNTASSPSTATSPIIPGSNSTQSTSQGTAGKQSESQVGGSGSGDVEEQDDCDPNEL